MRGLSLILTALFLLFAMTAGVGAQQDGWSGSLGSEATVYPSLADYSWLTLSLDFSGFTLSSTTSVSYAAAFSVSQGVEVAFGWNSFTLGSELWLGIFPFPAGFSSARIYGEVTLFDMPLDGASFSGGPGVSVTVYPSVASDIWLDLALGVDGFSVSSKTTFSLVPFGFSRQRLDLGLGFDGLSVYGWAALSHALDISAGLGFYFNFP